LAAFAIGSGKDSIFLARHPHLEPLSVLIELKRRKLMSSRIFVELHEPSHFLQAKDHLIDGYVVISEGLREHLIAGGVNPERVLLEPNAVSLKSYEQSHQVNQLTLREKLGLPVEQQIVCYTGQLGPGRNIETLIEALESLDHVFLAIVGGRNTDDIDRLKEFANSRGLATRIIFAGQQPSADTIDFQLASDVLVIPYNSGLAHSKWCSPLKLYEYLASGKVIAAFPIPPLRKALLAGEVVWAEEETAPALAKAISEAFTKKPRTFAEVQSRMGKLTWANRAERIAKFMGI
jgi:glycosyltransferase involved in cell wall biosynthesis